MKQMEPSVQQSISTLLHIEWLPEQMEQHNVLLTHTTV
jgi:hypothetical protein